MKHIVSLIASSLMVAIVIPAIAGDCGVSGCIDKQAISKISLDLPQVDKGVTPTFWNDFDVGTDEYAEILESEIPDFSEYKNLTFGAVKKPDDSVQKVSQAFVTYDSWWNPTQPDDTEDYVVQRHDTYYFSKYVDIPVKIAYTEGVLAHHIQQFTVTQKFSSSESKSETVTKGCEVFSESSIASSIELGASIGWDSISGSASTTDGTEAHVSRTLSEEITAMSSETTSYEEIYERTYTFENDTDSLRYYQLNYRQKFRLYFTTVFNYNYAVTTWYSGLWNKDTHYDYTPLDPLTGNRTNYFLVPVDSIYFSVSEYIDDSNGNKVIDGVSNSSIVHF